MKLEMPVVVRAFRIIDQPRNSDHHKAEKYPKSQAMTFLLSSICDVLMDFCSVCSGLWLLLIILHVGSPCLVSKEIITQKGFEING